MEPKVKVAVKLDLGDLARAIADQHQDSEVLWFLGKLDEAMASWDFTRQMVTQGVGALLAETEGYNGSQPEEVELVARVAEFVRQAKRMPHVEYGSTILTCWTDPEAEAAGLDIRDLERLIALAAAGLKAAKS